MESFQVCLYNLPSLTTTAYPLLIQASYLGFMEITQLHAIGIVLYFKSFWNVLDLLTQILMIISVTFNFTRFSDDAGGALSPIIAIQVHTTDLLFLSLYGFA